MLLIGFTWIILPTIASLVIGLFIRGGRWEDHGPTVMMLTATGAFFGGTVGAAIADGVLGYNWSSGSNPTLGLTLSLLGALAAFAMYVFDVRRYRSQHAS